MRKIILNSTYEETVRATVLTALDEIEIREKEVLRANLELQNVVKDREKEVLRANLELQNVVKDKENDVLRAKLETESFKSLL